MFLIRLLKTDVIYVGMRDTMELIEWIILLGILSVTVKVVAQHVIS